MASNGKKGDILRVFEAFCGYGSQRLALKRLKKNYPKFNFKVVGISDIDKYALAAYKQLHGDCPNYGDISKIDWEQVPDFDLFTYSFPYQDISIDGEQKGLKKNSKTNSSLLWECEKAIREKRPTYLVMENVPNLLSAKFRPYFDNWVNLLNKYGYTSYTQILNATDYGVPQNRKRVFCVSFRNDPKFSFPKPIARKNIDSFVSVNNDTYRSYYKKFTVNDGWYKRFKRDYDKETVEKCLGKDLTKAFENGMVNTDTRRKVKKVYVGCDFANTHFGSAFSETKSPTLCVLGSRLIAKEDLGGGYFRVRHLTPQEYFRLMGFEEWDICKMNLLEVDGKNVSNTRLYHLAGNGIVVDVLYHLFREMFIK